MFGVTGVGKTTLRFSLERRILEKFLPLLHQNPDQIAVSGIEAIPIPWGRFSYKDYYIRVLESLKKVLVEYKINYDLVESNFLRKQLSKFDNKDSTSLRRLMEKIFCHCQLKAFTVDQAEYLFMLASARQLFNQIDWIQSLAKTTETRHILFGDYKLPSCFLLRAQAARLSEDIHLLPYQVDNPGDTVEFIKVIKNFQLNLPLLQEPDLVQHYQYLFHGSVGCVGILKNWLVKSLVIALSEEAHTLTIKHLELGALESSRLIRIRQEAVEGFRSHS